MNTVTPGSGIQPLRLDDLLALLPDPAERPLLGALVAASRPDPGRRWAGSGALGTLGTRIVTPEALEAALSASLEAETARLEARARTLLALSRALAGGRRSEAVELLLQAGESAEGASHHEEARGWYGAARVLAMRLGHPRRTEALRRRARAARGAGDLPAAAAEYREAWFEGRREAAWVDAVVAGTGRGNVAIDRGAWEEAKAWYEPALALTESPRIGPELRPGLAWPLAQNLAIVAREEGRLADAERWLTRGESWAAEAAARDPDDEERWRLDLAHARGQVALARGEVALAIARFREALAGPGTEDSRIGVQGNLALALLEAGRTLEAAEVVREAEASALRHGALGRLPELYRTLARITRARGEGEPFVFLDHARTLIRRHALPAREEVETLRLWAALRREDPDPEAPHAALAAEAEADALLAALKQREATTPHDTPDDLRHDPGHDVPHDPRPQIPPQPPSMDPPGGTE